MWDESITKTVLLFLESICEGNEVFEDAENELLIISNPSASDENIALYGVNPNIVLDLSYLRNNRYTYSVTHNQHLELAAIGSLASKCILDKDWGLAAKTLLSSMENPLVSTQFIVCFIHALYPAHDEWKDYYRFVGFVDEFLKKRETWTPAMLHGLHKPIKMVAPDPGLPEPQKRFDETFSIVKMLQETFPEILKDAEK